MVTLVLLPGIMRHVPAEKRLALFEINVHDEIHLDAVTTGLGNTNFPPSRRRGRP